jgi:hypothetical protein
MHQGPESSQCPDSVGQIVDGRADRHVDGMGDTSSPLDCTRLRKPRGVRGVVVCDHQLAARPEPAGAGHAHPADAYDNDDIPHFCPQSPSPTIGKPMFSNLTWDKLPI